MATIAEVRAAAQARLNAARAAQGLAPAALPSDYSNFDDPTVGVYVRRPAESNYSDPSVGVYVRRPPVSKPTLPFTPTLPGIPVGGGTGGLPFTPMLPPPPTQTGNTDVPISPHEEPTMPYDPYQPNGGGYLPQNGGLGDVGRSLCDFLPEQYKAACKAGVTYFAPGSQPGQSTQCPVGYTWSETFKSCIKPTAALPGGQPFTLGGTGVATTGGLGLSAITPTQVGTITRRDGTTGPILKCPRRYVLGQDYLCYPKSMIPNQLRAHPRGTRPLLTGGEVKILRRAKGLEKKVSKLGKQYGSKVCHCSTRATRSRKK